MDLHSLICRSISVEDNMFQQTDVFDQRPEAGRLTCQFVSINSVKNISKNCDRMIIRVIDGAIANSWRWVLLLSGGGSCYCLAHNHDSDSFRGHPGGSKGKLWIFESLVK